MEDEETVERKNRNLVRKKAAGGEMLQEEQVSPTDTFLGWWANSRAQLLFTGWGTGGHSKQLILETQMLPGPLGHHMATSTGNG